MGARTEHNKILAGLAALLLSGMVLVAGATAAAALDGYGSDCADCGTPPVTTPEAPRYGSTYPVPPAPPPPGRTDGADAPPVLPRTGSSTTGLVLVGAGAVALGGGFVVLARRRRLALVTT